MPVRRLFDRIVAVDWSAASSPRRGRDSIWIGSVDRRGSRIENLATRRVAEHRLTELLDDRAGPTLVGVDFSLGYPAGTAAALGLPGTPWRAMWELLERTVVDDERNRNNRFEVAAALNRRSGFAAGPFWGCPRGRRLDALTPTKPPGRSPLPEWRAVERALRAAGHRPFSSWQLLGAGCVGSQSLVGIPVLERLRRAAPGRVHVWPFTTGLEIPAVGPGDVVVAEVWPTLIAPGAGADRAGGIGGVVRDAAQVEAVAARFAALDRDGRLAALFAPSVGDGQTGAITDEEGWVLGATADPTTHRAAVPAAVTVGSR